MSIYRISGKSMLLLKPKKIKEGKNICHRFKVLKPNETKQLSNIYRQSFAKGGVSQNRCFTAMNIKSSF